MCWIISTPSRIICFTKYLLPQKLTSRKALSTKRCSSIWPDFEGLPEVVAIIGGMVGMVTGGVLSMRSSSSQDVEVALLHPFNCLPLGDCQKDKYTATMITGI